MHTDHLGTPRAVTDAKRTIVWTWPFQANPFGEATPDEDPDGDRSEFVLNLRFPGQYFDAASALHYNYFRDYEPGTGRYIESDPIGLWGGTSTYPYALNNPIRYFDPFGRKVTCSVIPDRQGPWQKKKRRIVGDWTYYSNHAEGGSGGAGRGLIRGLPFLSVVCVCRRESVTEITYVATFKLIRLCLDDCTGEVFRDDKTEQRSYSGGREDPWIEYKHIPGGYASSHATAELDCRVKCSALN